MTPKNIFITGATGHVGRSLIPALAGRGHKVRALVRAGSEARLPAGCESIVGNALDANTYADKISAGDTLVHLVGVTHPSPAKAEQFRTIDLKSALEAVSAAEKAGVKHLVYVSVAQPAPVRKAYIEARSEAEAAIRSTGIPSTILRPWYVLGPGRLWPIFLIPMYKLMEIIPSTCESARRLGLVSIKQMVATLCAAIENPPPEIRIVTVPEIRGALAAT
jgi:uncharacterized protein YbjT (DUF2867 family)